jgi:hypothetical protein
LGDYLVIRDYTLAMFMHFRRDDQVLTDSNL